jgi:hypothetical protein
MGIEIDQLPLTFRDAVSICRRLDIKYLWIESLCIIQDSDEAWRLQAASMANIYENARITIAAASAGSLTDGCFRKTHWFCIGQPLPEHPGIYVRREAALPSAYERFGWPLSERGWVFQELSLSLRTIHFSSEEVMWQCRSKFDRKTETTQFQTADVFHFQPNFSPAKGESLRRIWYGIVDAYSWRKLSS